ncbi:MAG: zinc ribbon domain-containing protein [Candidatus Thermoplasmatota archaeon]|nr:zinc ribbon domain-containing protein [Candidatus Thermoplasmatota archaeon]
MPNVVQSSDGKRSKWGLFTTLLITSLLFMAVGASIEPDRDLLDECGQSWADVNYNDSEECQEARDQEASSGFVAGFGGLFCCGAIIVGIVAASSSSSSTKTVIVNQGFVPQTTMVQPNQQVIHTGTVMKPGMTGQMPLDTNRSRQAKQQANFTQTSAPAKQQENTTSAPSMDEIDKLAAEAKNLELARDFTKAAEMYQKAGLFAEAGRIRQTYLENDKPVVQIGQIGDSVVKDSVIMGNQKSNLCPNCGIVTQPEWNFCPSCNISL